MKKIVLFALLFPIYTLYAQSVKEEKSYQSYSYEEYIEKFESLPNKTFEIKKVLAESYFKTHNYYKAEEYYKEIVSSVKSISEDVYNYASVLLINQKYSDTEFWMEKFADMEKCDSRAKRFIENKDYYVKLLNDDKKFKIKNINTNTEFKDFGASFYNKKIVFSSTRPSKNIFKRLFALNRLSLQLFVADDIRGELLNVKSFKKKNNEKLQEWSASFSNKGTFAAFTLNNYSSKNKKEVIQLEIVTSKRKDNKWVQPEPVPFNNVHYSVGYPSLTSSGSKMYFASDMPGGYGGIDIWVVEKTNDDKWGIPKNLGNIINTEGDEMFPFIHENGMLFFASDGLLGLGGLDIFYTKFANGKYLIPKNVGVPVNSSNDDFSFIIDKKMRRGYFSSNREEGKGSDDIYSFKLLNDLIFDIILKGKIVDINKNKLANSHVSLYDNEGNIIKTVNSDKNGDFSFKLKPKSVYRLMGAKPKYTTDIKDINTNSDKTEYLQTLELEKLPDFNIKCSVSEEKSRTPISGVNVICINNNNNSTKNFVTYNSGEFLVKLTDAKLNDTVNYSFILVKDGYASKTIKYSQLLYRNGEYNNNIKMQKIEVGKDLGKILAINPIYFDFDKSNIRPDAALELDKIVKIMNEYPNMLIELSSHTDCRGSAIYNLKLSDRRAKASAHYIKKRISKPTRIYGEGFGEKRLINKCPCVTTGDAKCSEKDHQENRRTEFKIIRK